MFGVCGVEGGWVPYYLILCLHGAVWVAESALQIGVASRKHAGYTVHRAL